MTIDKNMPVLIVDDYKTMLRIVRSLLNKLGFNNIDEATDGQSALEKLSKSKYGLIVSDWNMEPMSGIDLLKQVRGNDQFKGIPFILITAESKVENIMEAQKAGVNGYIVKPFSADTLKTKLSDVFGEF